MVQIMSEIIIRPINIERDAEGIAAMWNASDLQWPGSFTHGVPTTAQAVRQWQEEERTLVTFVAEADGDICGYCSFVKARGRKGEGSLDLLNVHPQYQRRGVGRRLIQATIEQSVKEGWKRQSLGTWPANFKAVPLYKKTGHFWTPNTSVWMQNFVPGALQLSLAKPFFEKHDWYDCLVREIPQKEDDQRWEGLKVFCEHWEADGESLTIWIDREARAPVAVETNALLVAAIAEEIEPLAGSKVNLRWRVVNKLAQPLHVYLHAVGDKGLTIDHREAFIVPGGERVEHLFQVEVAHDAPQQNEDGTAPAVRSIVRLNDQDVELFSGFRVKKPITLNTTPAQITLQPTIAGSVNLELHSELDHAVVASIYLTLPEGLGADWATRKIDLPAKGHIPVPLILTPSAETIYPLPVRVEFKDAESPKPVTETLAVFSLGPGGLLCHQQGESARLETEALRVTAEAKGGAIKVEHKATRLTMAKLRCTVGPPYSPSEFEGVDFCLSLEQRSGRAIVHLAGEAKNYAGLYLHQELSLSSTGLAALRCYLENRGGEDYAKRLWLGVGSSSREQERLTLPLRQGVVQSPASIYPIFSRDDAPREATAYREPWLAREREGVVAGVAWDSLVTEIEHDWGRVGLSTAELSVPSGKRSKDICLALYVGDGDWHDARRVALRWSGAWQPDEEPPTVRPPILARIEPKVLVTTGDAIKGHLLVDTASKRPASGRVVVEIEKGVSVEPHTVPVTDLIRGKSIEQDLRFTLPKGALRVFDGQVHLTLALEEVARPFHLVRLGNQAPITVRRGERSGQEVWGIDNGSSNFVVAPAFGLSVIAWTQGGANQLCSAFPEPQGFSWLYPWFGGIHPALRIEEGHLWEGYLPGRVPLAEPVETVDKCGLTWKGVRLTARPAKKEFRDLEIETNYLTLGGADLLKYVVRLRNLRATQQVLTPKTTVACCLGAEPTQLTLRGQNVVRRPTMWGTEVGNAYWGTLTNERTGKSLLMVSTNHDVSLLDEGQHGRELTVGNLVRLAGNEVYERTYYLVLADSLARAQTYKVMKDYGG